MAILDMNEELAAEVVKEIGGGKTKFFEANVLETESIAAAVKGALAWVKETGKEVGGVIAAAGVSTPAKVCLYLTMFACPHSARDPFDLCSLLPPSKCLSILWLEKLSWREICHVIL